jgi:putative protease
MQEQEIGYISNYFGNIEVVIIEMTNGTLETGDTVHFKGHTTDFTTTVASMQIEHEQVEKVKKDDSVGLKVSERVRKTDKVYKVIDQ